MARGYLVGDTGYLLLLQRLVHIDDVCGKPLVHGVVEVAHGAQTDDVLPLVVLLEHIKHLLLAGHWAQLAGIFARGDTQQHTIAVGHEVKEIDLTGAGQQGTIEVVDEVVYLVAHRIELALAFEQLHLRHVALLAEEAYGFLGSHHAAAYGRVGVYYLQHAAAYTCHIVGGNVSSQIDVYIVTLRHRYVYTHLHTAVEVVDGFAAYKE